MIRSFESVTSQSVDSVNGEATNSPIEMYTVSKLQHNEDGRTWYAASVTGGLIPQYMRPYSPIECQPPAKTTNHLTKSTPTPSKGDHACTPARLAQLIGQRFCPESSYFGPTNRPRGATHTPPPHPSLRHRGTTRYCGDCQGDW